MTVKIKMLLQVDSFMSDLRRMEEESVLQEAEHIKNACATAGSTASRGGRNGGAAPLPSSSSHVARMPLEVRADGRAGFQESGEAVESVDTDLFCVAVRLLARSTHTT